MDLWGGVKSYSLKASLYRPLVPKGVPIRRERALGSPSRCHAMSARCHAFGQSLVLPLLAQSDLLFLYTRETKDTP